jgi:uncharacterized protein (TIGR02246 family)
MVENHWIGRTRITAGTAMLAIAMQVIVCIWQPAWAGPADEIRARLQQWLDFQNAENADGLAGLYDENARLFSTGGSEKPLDGRDAIRAYFAQIFKHGHSSVALDHDDDIQLLGDVAIDTGYYHFDTVDTNGQPLKLFARYTFVVEKKGSLWTIIHHHSSRVPRPTIVPAQ